MQNLVCGLPDRDRHDWHGWTTRERLDLDLLSPTRATTFASILLSQDSTCRRTFSLLQLLLLRPLLRSRLQDSHVKVASTWWTTLTTPRLSRTSVLGSCNCRTAAAGCKARCCANGFPAPVTWWIRRSLTPEWTRSTTVMPSLTLPSLTMHWSDQLDYLLF